MPNSIMTQEFADTIVFDTKERLPILEGRRINKKLSERLEEGSGSTVSVLVPGMNEVVKGAATDANASVNVQKVPVVVNQWNISAPYTLQDETLNLNTFETQVSKPNAIKLAAKINKAIFDTVGNSACNASIVSNLGDLAVAIGTVDASRIGETKSAMVNPVAIAKIINGGAGSFGYHANPSRGMKLYEGVIGEYFDCDVFKSPDAGTITGISLAGTVTAGLANGSTSLTVTGFAAGTVIPAGTPFRIAGVQTTDAFGNPIGPRTFITTEDVTTASSTVLPVGKIWLAGGGFPIPNTIGAGTAIASILTAGTLYGKGLVMAENAGAFASIVPAPYPGTNDSVATRIAGELNIRSSIFSNLESGMIRWRFDVLYGVSSLYGQGANMMYIPMS